MLDLSGLGVESKRGVRIRHGDPQRPLGHHHAVGVAPHLGPEVDLPPEIDIDLRHVFTRDPQRVAVHGEAPDVLEGRADLREDAAAPRVDLHEGIGVEVVDPEAALHVDGLGRLTDHRRRDRRHRVTRRLVDDRDPGPEARSSRSLSHDEGDRDRDQGQDDRDTDPDRPGARGEPPAGQHRRGLDLREPALGLFRLGRQGSGFAVDLGHGEHVPGRVDAFQRVVTPVLEPEPRARDQVARRRRHQDIARASERHHTGPDDHGDPPVPPTCSHSPKCTPARISIPSSRTASEDGARAPDRTRRFREAREEAVPGGIELLAAVPLQFTPHYRRDAGRLVPSTGDCRPRAGHRRNESPRCR